MKNVLAVFGAMWLGLHVASALGFGHAVTMWEPQPITCTVGQSQENQK